MTPELVLHLAEWMVLPFTVLGRPEKHAAWEQGRVLHMMDIKCL